MKTSKPENIDEYISGFPPEVQKVLVEIRAAIKEAAPAAVEAISYDMPAFTLHNAPLVYFAAYKKHVGLYSVPTQNEAFKTDFSVYKTGRGSIQFPLDQPMPLSLIARIVKFRAKENEERRQKK